MAETDHPGILTERVYESRAYEAYLRLRSLAINFSIYERDYQELKRMLHEVSRSEVQDTIWNFTQPEAIDAVMLEVTRLTANFLAAAKTLVDHTRAAINTNYEATEFIREYRSEVARRFAASELNAFIEDLRNYALHYSLPFPQAEMTIDATGFTKRFVLDVTALRRWRNWEKGKPYLERAGASIDLEAVIDEYHSEINDFHGWLHSRLQQIHAEDLRWLAEMESRIRVAEANMHRGKANSS